MLDFNIGENKEFFRVKKILDELKESPDFKKDRVIILCELAQKLYKNLEIKVDTKNIRGYRFSGTKIISSNMTEDDLIKETTKAIEEQINVDVAIENLTSLVRFWKQSSSEKDVYKPFLDEVVAILNETAVFLNDSKKVEDIKNIIKSKEEMIDVVKKEATELDKSLKEATLRYRRNLLAIQPRLDDWTIVRNVLEFRLSSNQLTSPHLDQFTNIMLHLILAGGRDYVENVIEKLNITKNTIFEIVSLKDYANYLILNDTQTMIGIIDDKSYNFDIEKYLKDIESGKKPNNKIQLT